MQNLELIEYISRWFTVNQGCRSLRHCVTHINELQEWFSARNYELKIIKCRRRDFGIDYENPSEHAEIRRIFFSYTQILWISDRVRKFMRKPEGPIVGQMRHSDIKVPLYKDRKQYKICGFVAGMTDLIRPALYQAIIRSKIDFRREHVTYDVVGPIL
jgi:hypothetical protein